jgi:hypothetical protein
MCCIQNVSRHSREGGNPEVLGDKALDSRFRGNDETLARKSRMKTCIARLIPSFPLEEFPNGVYPVYT